MYGGCNTKLLAILLNNMQKLFENWRRFLSESITINGVPINVEISSDPENISKGLMHRKQLDSDSGMLFCFPDQQDRSFWMKNTDIPLSIAYANNDGNILNISSSVFLECIETGFLNFSAYESWVLKTCSCFKNSSSELV